jgi:hypothetical protein
VTAYCASTTATTTTTPAQTTGKTSLPATNDGGITGTWSSTVPSLTSGQYLYQTDGIYDPNTNKVTWSIPYWSSLKVGSLSAITTNTGTLNVSGTISSANGNFTVDNNGGVTMKSATIQDGSGNIILQAGVPLSSQTGQIATSINSAATTASWSGVSGTGKPADNASSDLVLAGNNVTLIGNVVTKTSATGNWDAQAYSIDSYTGGAYAAAVVSSVSGSIMFGLNTSGDLLDASYGGIDFAIYLNAGTLGVYESGGNLGTFGSYAAGDIFAAVYDGSSVRYLKNGVVFYTSISAESKTPGLKLYFDSTFYDFNAQLKNIRFGPMSSNNWANVGGTGKPADNATVGANATNFAATLGGDNLMNNSGFDVQTTTDANRPNGYVAYNNANISTSYIAVTGRLGGKAFGLRANTTGATTWGLHSRTTIIETDGTSGGVTGGWQANKTYVISFKAKKVNGADWQNMLLQWNNSPATTTSVSNPNLTTSWQQYTFRITWGSTVEAVGALYVDRIGTVAVNDEIHIDELIIQEGDVYSEWFLSSRDAATTATWATVTGANRPADNATVGATLGTNVNGQITSSNSSTLVGTGAINSVHISDLRTTNYAEDGSGNPTAGGKLASTGTAFKVAANSMQIGTNVLSDYWFRLLQGVDGNQSNNRIIWRGNNDATTRGGAPNIACLSVIPKPAMVDYTTNNLNGQWQGDASGRLTVYHSYVLTPTSYSGNTDNLDAMSQIHVQFFAKPTDLSPFVELYAACPSRTYDGVTGTVRGTWAIGFYYNGSSLANATYPSASDPNLSGVAPNVVFDTNGGSGGGQVVYIGYLRIRIANSYGWSATQDFAPYGSRTPGSNTNSYQNNLTLPTRTITGVAGSSGGGSGSQGGACPAPWVKVRLLNGKEINASDLHNGAKLAAVNDSTMGALPQGGTVRDLTTIWAQRYRVKLTNGEATEWSENHRFAVVGRGWVQVQNLRSGDQIMGLRESVVESILAVGEGQVVSFRVEGAGTYFAGGLLCHNTKTIT